MTARQNCAGAYGPHWRRDCRSLIASYEALKTAWVADNPDATSEEYEAAMRAIADLCGV